VQIPTAPASSYNDNDIQTLIQTMVSSGKLPAPTDQTLYALYFPANVTITLDDATSCKEFGAYHNEVSVTPEGGSAITVSYAVMPRCGGEQMTTLGASHELIEAATDAHPMSQPAFNMSDLAWSVLGGEVGDVCVDFSGSGNDTYSESGFTVQRTWSNKAAAASHDPCVPAPAGAYFNVAPDKQQIALGIGESAAIELTAFSDAPSGSWSVSAKDLGQFLGSGNVLTLSIDKTTVSNGDKTTLKVTLNSAISTGSTGVAGAPFAIVSRAGSKVHIWPVVVVPR
jgi:hypothetical protein